MSLPVFGAVVSRCLRSAAAIAVAAWCAAAAGPAPAGTAAPPPADPSALAAAIQARYDGIMDLSAAFTHAYEGGLIRKTVVERGTVRFKKPGMMRWQYVAPEKKEFVSDGLRLYAYVPDDRQVTIAALPSGDDLSTPALFLAGRGRLTRDFAASAAAAPGGSAAGAVAVTLTPRRRDADFEWMTLVVDAATLQVRGLVTGDAQGGTSSFTFSAVRENTGLADRDFRFTIPRGVDVITNTPGR